MLLVSHDRAFLDAVIHRIIAFSPTGAGVREYPGNYSEYVAIRQGEFDEAMAAYVDQQEEIKRLKKAALSARNLAQPHKGAKPTPRTRMVFQPGFSLTGVWKRCGVPSNWRSGSRF